MIMWDKFDANEIYLLVLNAAAYTSLFFVPKKFTPRVLVLSLLWGYSIGVLFDFTIGGGLIDFYRVNDSNRYEITDLLYYTIFAPFGYFFFHFYETFRIRAMTFALYVAGWSIIGFAMQWMLTLMGIITLQRGYQLIYSLPIFLITQSVTGLYYQLLRAREPLQKNKH